MAKVLYRGKMGRVIISGWTTRLGRARAGGEDALHFRGFEEGAQRYKERATLRIHAMTMSKSLVFSTNKSFCMILDQLTMGI